MSLQEIIENYLSNGWRLERILMTDDAWSTEVKSEISENVIREVSDINALWFSRKRTSGQEAWELRFAGSTPYALLELFEPYEPEEEQEERRKEMERELRERIRKKDA